MSSNERKLELVKEALNDLKYGKLTTLSAIIAISLIVNPKEPSKECTEWAKNAAEEHIKRERPQWPDGPEIIGESDVK